MLLCATTVKAAVRLRQNEVLFCPKNNNCKDYKEYNAVLTATAGDNCSGESSEY